VRGLAAGVAALFGLMFGSFLNVVVYRVPRKQSVVSPRSRCPSCGRELTALDNVPVFSWLILRGKCRTCGAAISPRYLIGEIATAVLWALAVLRLRNPWLMVVYGALFWVLLALALIDLEHKILPNRIVYPATVAGVIGFTIAGFGVGEPWWIVRGLLGGAATIAFFFIVALISPAGMGMGDVKLSFLIGLALGFAGWRSVFVGLFLSFLFGAVVGIALMLAGRAGRKTAVPFGPFMALGCVVTILWNDALVRLWPGLS
jgi:leader peptidase (prepilin peptidase)/N-methyltransferase